METAYRKAERPPHAVARRHLEPILFLADRLTGIAPGEPEGQPEVQELADLVGLHDYRAQNAFKELSERRACEALDSDLARKAALVTLALVLKTDTDRGDKANAYFQKIREALDVGPVAVPTDLAEHRALVHNYLRD